MWMSLITCGAYFNFSDPLSALNRNNLPTEMDFNEIFRSYPLLPSLATICPHSHPWNAYKNYPCLSMDKLSIEGPADYHINERRSLIVWLVVMTKLGNPTPQIYVGSSVKRSGGHLRLRTYKNQSRGSSTPKRVGEALENGYVVSKVIPIAGTPIMDNTNIEAAHQVCLIIMIEATLTFQLWSMKSTTYGQLQKGTVWPIVTLRYGGLILHLLIRGNALKII